MNIRDEEQLQQYFERQMTGTQEQNFLINVAARDDMRLAFRSQLELLKAVREDKDSSGSPTFVRSKTLTALGLGGALVPSSLKQHETEQASIAPTGMLHSLGSMFKRPAVSITLGLLIGVLGSSYFGQSSPNSDRSTAQPAVIAVPAAPSIQTQPAQVTTPVTDVRSQDEKAPVSAAKSTPTTVHHSSAKPEIPVVTSSKPGSVGVKTTIDRP